MARRWRDRWPGVTGLALVFVAMVVAAGDFEPSASTRGARSAERFWHGSKAVLGAEDASSDGLVWLARVLALIGLAVFAAWVWRRRRRRNDAAAAPPR